MPSLLSAQPPSVRPPSAEVLRSLPLSHRVIMLQLPIYCRRRMASSERCHRHRLVRNVHDDSFRLESSNRHDLHYYTIRTKIGVVGNSLFLLSPTSYRASLATRRFVDSPRHHDVPIITRHHSLSSEAEGPVRLRRRRAVLCRE